MPSDKTSSSKPRAVAAHGSSSGSGSTRTPARASTTSPSLSWKVPLALLVILMASSFTFIRDAIIDMGILLGTPPAINTEGCKPVGQLEACEDIYIHHASGLAFTACGRAETRKSWFPPVGKRNHSTVASAFEDNFVIYDLANGQHRIVEIDEFPKNTDRVFTGLDVYLRSENELTIFLVNHRRTGSVIEILEYTIGDERIQYKETISHELIRAPNDILAMSPRSFYVTNDHLHINGTFRMVEGKFWRRMLMPTHALA
ncbi:hypothetical protein BGW38_007023 [Lunasporangiospora selenospora]|uniref:Uncharacterized protein n=1 Tax=Lunasporangiospora selenospora TaxID=979761 RepID=A0A9P6FZF8_9FUNG|nr:hypothetical protein BGW38_007023 [Lunasporangiospora selenospora]